MRKAEVNKIKSVTVFIPTYNGQQYLSEIIEAILEQKINIPYEVLIIDSGSTDKTINIIKSFQKKHKNIRLHTIANSEYGHGKTRNLAAQLAKGEIVVYLSHDATPAHEQWLYEMVKPFEISENIVAVMGKQVPRSHCIPMLKYEINSVFSNFGPDFGTHIFYKDDFIKDQSTYDATRFYSDVNSASRKDFLTSVIPYRDVEYAEDQLFGEDVIEAGFIKVFAPRGSVIHSNDLVLKEYKKRLFDETLGLRKSGIKMSVPTKRLVCRMVVKGSIKDAVQIVKDKDYSVKRKYYWLVMNPCFHIEKWRGVRSALLVDINDISAHRKHSLEKSRK